jgi:hypothetical protein
VRAHHGGEGDDDVGLLEERPHERLVADVAEDEVEVGVRAEMQQRRLSEDEAVDAGDLMPRVEQVLTEDRADVARCPGDEHFGVHAWFLLSEIEAGDRRPARRASG